MSCQHGNWPPCAHCDEIDAAVAHAVAPLQAEIEALRAEVGRDAVDAERYRWLRQRTLTFSVGWYTGTFQGDSVDEAVDAARKREEE